MRQKFLSSLWEIVKLYLRDSLISDYYGDWERPWLLGQLYNKSAVALGRSLAKLAVFKGFLVREKTRNISEIRYRVQLVCINVFKFYCINKVIGGS